MNLRRPYHYTLVLLPFLQKESPKVSQPQSCHSPNTRPSHSDHSNTHWSQLPLLSFNVHVLGAAQTLSVKGLSHLASAHLSLPTPFLKAQSGTCIPRATRSLTGRRLHHMCDYAHTHTQRTSICLALLAML